MDHLGRVAFPGLVVVDTREQAAYGFDGIQCDRGLLPRDWIGTNDILVIPTVREGLKTGDYSLRGCEADVAIERKSIGDLFGTIGQGRNRFERELERLSTFRVALVMVEATWEQVITAPPDHTRLAPKTIVRSVIAWRQRWPTVHWDFVGPRRLAEVMTFRVLERFWRKKQQIQEPSNASEESHEDERN